MTMALTDYVPTLLYLVGSWYIVRMMRRLGERELAVMFMAGATLAGLAGVLKATSKLFDAVARRPVTETGFMYDQMFPVIAVGFMATATAIVLGARRYSGRDAKGERTAFAETAAWVSPFLAGIFLGLAVALVMSKDSNGGSLAQHFVAVKRGSMFAMIILQMATVGILAWFAFREKLPIAGFLAIVSIVTMLLMGMLASPSVQDRFSDKNLMNWVDQTVNLVCQATFVAAARIMWIQARDGRMTGITRAVLAKNGGHI